MESRWLYSVHNHWEVCEGRVRSFLIWLREGSPVYKTCEVSNSSVVLGPAVFYCDDWKGNTSNQRKSISWLNWMALILPRNHFLLMIQKLYLKEGLGAYRGGFCSTICLCEFKIHGHPPILDSPFHRQYGMQVVKWKLLMFSAEL